jgi:hypothetical protein
VVANGGIPDQIRGGDIRPLRFFIVRRCDTPTTPKPASISTHVAGSGTARVVKLYWLDNPLAPPGDARGPNASSIRNS